MGDGSTPVDLRDFSLFRHVDRVSHLHTSKDVLTPGCVQVDALHEEVDLRDVGPSSLLWTVRDVDRVFFWDHDLSSQVKEVSHQHFMPVASPP